MSEIVGQGISRENLEGAFNNFIDRISNDEHASRGLGRRSGGSAGDLGLQRGGDELHPLFSGLGLAEGHLGLSAPRLVTRQPKLGCHNPVRP